MNSTQIAVIHKGIVAEVGAHQQLVVKGGIYAQLVARQMQRNKDQLNEEKDDSPSTPAPQLQRSTSEDAPGASVDNVGAGCLADQYFNKAIWV